MRRAISLAAILAALSLILAVPAGAAAQGRSTASDRDGNKIFDQLDDLIDGRSPGSRVQVIALFKSGSSEERVAEAKRSLGNFHTLYEYETMPGMVAELTVGQVRALAARSETLQIQHNARLDFALDTARAAFGVDKAVADFGQDGNNENSLVCPGLKQYCADDTVVAVLDTGIYWGHQDLDEGKVIANQDCSSGECMNMSGLDTNGHGTHVASIVAGSGDVNPAHRGVAPGAALVNVRVGSSFSTTVAALDAGMEWTIANRDRYGIEVMNMSLNGTSPSDGTESTARLANRAAAAGILPVASAGNRGPASGGTSYPGSAKFALQVGNMADPHDPVPGYPAGFSLTWSSGRGPTLDGRTKPDLVAPGTDITAAWIGADRYEVSGGTSMSSPFAAGAAALVLDADPALATSGTACDPADISAECADGVIDSTMDTRLKDTLTSTTVDWGPPGPDNDYGHGRLDVYAAVDAASPIVGTGGPDVPTHVFRQGSLSGTGATSDHAISVTHTGAPIAVTLLWARAADLTSPDFDLQLLNPSGTQVASAAMTNNWRSEVLEHMPTTTGTYTVRVRSTSGSGPYWVDVSFPGNANQPPPQPPASPTDLSATARSASQIDLSWTDATGESGYRVERSADGLSGWVSAGATGANATGFSNTGLAADTTYYYRVVAFNESGDSPPSNVASARTLGDTIAPTAPRNLKATGGKAKVTLSWTASTDSGGSGLKGYKVFRSTTGTTGAYSQIGAPTTTSFTDTAVVKGKVYYYYVVAYDNTGNHSPASAKVSGKPT